MKRITLVLVGIFALSPSIARGQEYKAHLTGFEETGASAAPTGAILTNGTGTLVLHVDRNNQTATYELTYTGLTSNVLQAHFHFGKVHVPGGIFVFLCTNLGNGPAGTPACPNPEGTVTGTITAADIIADTGQNITAGSFDALIAALDSDTIYANVHTNNFKAGEIRGQVQKGRQNGDRQNGEKDR
jgi:CHRD domain-containing protein